MDLQLLYHPQFSKDVKRLSKKYKSLVSDLKKYSQHEDSDQTCISIASSEEFLAKIE